MASMSTSAIPNFNSNSTTMASINSNISLNTTGGSHQCLSHLGQYKLLFQIIIIIAGSLIFFIGITGNLMVVFTVYRNRHTSMSSLTYTLIASLSIYDIMVVTLSMPFTLTEDLLCYFPFGKVLCYIIEPLPALFATGSVLTMTAIGIDRYRAVACSLEYHGSQRKKFMIPIIVFILSFICSLAGFILTRYDDVTNPDYPSCSMTFINLTGPQIYVPVTFIFLFILPLLITLTIYIRAIIYLRYLGKAKTNLLKKNRTFYNTAARSSIKMMLIITIIFVVCWLPLYFCFFVIAFPVLAFLPTQNFFMMYTISHFLSYINAAANPIIYAGFNKKFRSNLKLSANIREKSSNYTVA